MRTAMTVLTGGVLAGSTVLGMVQPADATDFRTQLTAKLDGYLHGRRLTVAVRDLSTGVTYVYNSRLRVATASVVKVEILAGLLLQAQRARRRLSAGEKALAARMIEYSDNDAATALYNRIGGAGGLAWTGRKLKLRHTVPGPPGYWGSTTTSASDQVKILSALATADSPLTKTHRQYALSLMSKVTSGQDWGVSAAATGHDSVALKNGWLPRAVEGGLWTVNSIGKVGHLLIAVLSSRNAGMSAGVVEVERVARLVAKGLPKEG